eukprot:scaffold49588_cov46-Phaeocystis_antarctica.AAC.2
MKGCRSSACRRQAARAATSAAPAVTAATAATMGVAATATAATAATAAAAAEATAAACCPRATHAKPRDRWAGHPSARWVWRAARLASLHRPGWGG